MHSAPASPTAAVAQLHSLHRGRADAGLDRALRAVPVPDNPLAPVRQAQDPHLRQERVSFRSRRVAALEHIGERILVAVGLMEGNKCNCS